MLKPKFKIHISMNKQQGIGLIEIMVGMVIGLVILGGVLTMYSTSVSSSSDTLKAAKLNQELNAAMSIMVRDIRRAGYWGTATIDNLDNPFMVNDTTNLEIKSATCVLFTYDRNANGSTAAEQFGFKLANGELQMRTGAGVANTDDCATGTWVSITDSDVVTISSLNFTSTGSKCLNSSSSASPQTNWAITGTSSTSFPCRDLTGTGYSAPASGDILIETRHVNIALEGALVVDANVQKILNESIKIRNDRVTQTP